MKKMKKRLCPLPILVPLCLVLAIVVSVVFGFAPLQAGIVTAPSSAFNLTGFASGATGGGVIDEADPAYRKVTTALEFITAIRDANSTPKGVTTPKVIEIMNDLNLGWNEIGAEAQGLASNPARAHNAPKLHPVLIASGVTLLDIKPKAGGLTLFSANGSTIRHCTFNVKSTTNIIIRNLRFDEMWEWDEATKGDYDSNDWDFITLGNGGDTSHVWIDHCTFTKAYDGITDMKAKAANVTYSWCRIEGGDDAPGGFIRQQIDALEAGKSGTTVYKFLRDTAGFTPEEIAFIMRGQKKGILMGANSLKAENALLTGTFHHILMTNLWDRAIPRLRGGNVHIYNSILDDTEALVAKRLRDTRAAALTSAQQNTLANTYHFNPPLNGCISTEDGAILLEKSVYTDCLWPLRNNQTDVNNPAYTGKILGLDVIYNFTNTDTTVTTVRGNSTDEGNPLGPKQAAIKPFSWNLAGGVLPYTISYMDDPSTLETILQAGAGAGVIEWSDGDKYNWLKTTYPAAPVADVAPVITVQPRSQAAIAGATVTLSVVATGSPVLSYQWYKDSAVVSTGGTGSTLTLANIGAANEGSYHVVVSNGIAPDATSDTAVIALAAPPLPPVAAAATAITGSTFTANWAASDNATGYSIDVSPDPLFGSFWPGCETLDVGNVTSKTITGLNPATTYYYRVRATVGSYATADSNVITAATSNVTLNALVNDAMGDNDRNSAVASPTATNTQWVTNSSGAFTPSATGLKWTLNGTSNAMCLGYFPLVSVGIGEANSVTLTLNFTTGDNGATVGNLRTALINDTAGGRVTADGFSSTNSAYDGDVGYGVFSASSNVGAGNTIDLVLRTYKRNATGSTNLLGTLGDWGDAAGTTTSQMGNSSDATGYLAANTAYTLAITLSYDGTTLSIRTQLTGGNMSGMDYTVTDNTTPILGFNALAIRPDKAAGQFSFLNITGLQITQGAGTPIPAVPSIYSASTATGRQGNAFTYATAATNGPITHYAATGLPAGLTCDSNTGVISGAPVESGTFDVTLTATNANGAGTPFALTLTIGGPPPVAPAVSEATIPTASGFTANWAAVPGASGYLLDVSTSPDFSTFVSGYEGLDVGDATSYTLADLAPGTTYYYRVSACAGDVVGDSSATITVTTSAGGSGYLVNDTFTDTDRIGGSDGSSTSKTGGPFAVTPTGTNTQWVANQVSTLVATGTDLTWSYTGVSSVMAMGYFPDVTVGTSGTVTVQLKFTTGAAGTGVDNLRAILIDDTVGGRVDNDGFSSSEARQNGDKGYAVFSAASTVGNGTTDLGLKTYKRTTTASDDLLSSSGNWTTIAPASAGSTGYLEGGTAYTLTFMLAYDGATLSMRTKLEGGNFTGLDYTVTDSASPVLTFNAIGLRLGKGTLQFSQLKFDSLKIWEGDEPAAAPAAPVLSAATGVAADGFSVNWTASPGATGYYLDVSTDPAFGSFVAGYNNLNIGNVTSYAVTGLMPGVTYYYRVRAAGAGGTSASSASGTVATTAAASYLVNDTFTDYDRIGGFDGSATAPDSPIVSVPTDTNTQWVATSTSTLVATGTGMVWNYVGTGNSMAVGYFPDVTVAASSTVTVQLKFTTGVVGTGTNNLRIALLNDTANGRFSTDGVTASSSYYEGDTGYAIMSASSNIGNSTANLVLRTYKRINTTATDLLGTAGNWGTATGTTSQIGNSTGSTGYLQGENDYTLTVTLAKNTAGTEMTIGTKLEGGNFSGLEYSVVDQDATVAITSTFNALAFRLGGSTTQYDHIKFTSLKIWEGEEPAASAPVINSPLTATATVGEAFNYTITASNSPTSYAATGLPIGLSLDPATGVITGTPLESGTFNVALAATNDVGTSPAVTLVLTVNPAVTAVPVITSATTATAVVGTEFTYTITADNSPAGFAATGLPASFALDPATGVISGTAVTGDIGPHPVVLTATNAIGASLPVTLTLTVEPPPALATPVASPATGVTTTGFIARWETVTGATGYRLDIATDSAFSSFVSGYNDLDVGAARLRAITGLAPDTPYYYRVRAADDSGPTASSNVITVRTADTETVLVDDRFDDTDRIGGADGSTSTSSSPVIGTPTATNTQWLASRVKQLVASATGMKWNFDTTSSIGALGYFPAFNVNNGQTVTLKLDFTTGTFGPAANNLRIALLNGVANGRRATDGFNPGGTGDPAFVGDIGYGIFTNSMVGGTAASPVTLAVNKRLATSNAALLNTTADWGTPPNSTENMGSSGTPPDDHLFAANTAYSLIVTLTRESATSLAITAQITGGNLTRLICTGVDITEPVTTFDTIAFRFGQGSNQFSDVTFTGLTIATTGSGVATEPPSITSALTASGLLGSPFTYTIAASNMPTGFTASGLPAGLALNPATGVISGTPAVTGSFAVTIGASNAIGSDSRQLDLRVTAGQSDIGTVVSPGGLGGPTSTVFDADGNGFIADVASGTIKKVAPGGAVSTFATIPQLAVLAIDAAGNLYTAGDDGNVRKVLADGTVVSPALATGVTTPGGIAAGPDGVVYVSKTAANTIVKITSAGVVSTLAGSGAAGSADSATGTAATFNGPTGLALNSATGLLYVADTVNCTLREINLATGAVATVAGQPGVPGDTGSAGDNGKAADGTLDTPEAIAIDDAGLLYIADTGNNLIRGFDPVSGALVTLAGDTGATTLSAPAGLAFDPVSGLLHVADTGNNALRVVTIKPVIAAKITDRVVALGSSVTLDGTAWASPAAAYVWSVHGQPLPATGATLSIDVNSVTDSGVYTIVATNTAGSGTASMRLTVSDDNWSGGSGSGGGGGGAPGLWLLAGIALLVLVRKLALHRATLLALLLSLLAIHATPFSASLMAQQTAADEDDTPDEVVAMSAFEVRSESVKGYTASESVTGTRVASLLRELPFNVNVVTSEFISDFNALELADQLSNVSSFSPSENTGQYQLRGFQASTQLVDGFRRVGLTGVTVTDRVEVIKGPAASIYGAIQPGGAVNTLRKKPTSTPKYGVTAGFGTKDQARGSFYASGPAGTSDKLFYRIDTEYRTADRQQEFAKTRNEYIAAQLVYKPTSRTTIGLFIDYADRHDFNTYQMATAAVNLDTSNPPSWFTYSLDGYQRYFAKSYTQYFGMDYDYYDFNLLGPNANKYNRLTAGSLTLDHKFNAAWSLRASFNMSYNPTHGEKAAATYYPFGEAAVSSATTEPPPASVKLTPQHDEGVTKATGLQIDNLFRFSTGPVRHQFLVTTDYYRNSDYALSIKWPVSLYYDPLDPYGAHGIYRSYDYPTWEEDPSNYTVPSTHAKTISRDYGIFLSERATMFNGRLIAMIGGRYDYVDSTAEHKPTEDEPTAKKTDYNVDAWTYQAGLTAIVSRNISLYANASSAFDPQPQLDENDEPLPNIESDGYEFGVKLTLLQERLNITLNRFHIRQKNLVTSITDAITQQKEVILTGEQIAKGYEVDFNWQVTRSLNVVGGYGYVDAKITDAGKLNWMNDTTPRRVPKHNLGTAVRYEFVNGRLKGLFALAGVTYYSKSLVNLGSGKALVPYTGAPTVSGMQQNQIYNARFPNGGLPYPYLPENAVVTYYDSATKYLYWTDVAGAATTVDLMKYSYADPYMSGMSYVLDGREQNYNRSSIVWKAGVGYKFKTRSFGHRLSHKIQVNMDNVFDEKSTLAGGIPLTERTVMVTYSLSF
ncbi:TonB-dependent receptor [Termitidicoccus mucosus]|uniref:Staphylococcus aureus surface protein A n=1 Tax=Termitidicoccus mucosus TaxID=1184151 RepID=A0A178IQF7_9BACT|nr:hypothetical protein AW736_03085 [Opitutaceae bacterium TSB47]